MTKQIDPNLKYLLEHKYTKIIITLLVIFTITSIIVMLYMLFSINEISTIDLSKLPKI